MDKRKKGKISDSYVTEVTTLLYFYSWYEANQHSNASRLVAPPSKLIFVCLSTSQQLLEWIGIQCGAFKFYSGWIVITLVILELLTYSLIIRTKFEFVQYFALQSNKCRTIGISISLSYPLWYVWLRLSRWDSENGKHHTRLTSACKLWACSRVNF